MTPSPRERLPGCSIREQDIDNILSRCQTVVHTDNPTAAGAEPLGSGFSKAHFVSDSAGEVDIDDPDFWTKAVGLAPPKRGELYDSEHEQLDRKVVRVDLSTCFLH